MGTIKLLKEAILEQNWDKVKEFYYEFTGESIDSNVKNITKKEYSENYIVQIKNNNKKQIKKQVVVDTSTGETKNFGVFEPVNPDKIKSVGNLWNPDDYIPSIPKEEEEENKKTQYKNKQTKNIKTKPFKMVVVTCRSCNKQFEVNPAFAKDKFICDKCIKGKVNI